MSKSLTESNPTKPIG